MKTKTIQLTNCTVGELKKALENIQDDTYINIANTGSSAIIRNIDMDITQGIKTSRVCINIAAEKIN